MDSVYNCVTLQIILPPKGAVIENTFLLIGSSRWFILKYDRSMYTLYYSFFSVTSILKHIFVLLFTVSYNNGNIVDCFG